MTRRRSLGLVAGLLTASLLAGCAGPAATPTPVPTAVPTAAPTGAPTAAPTEVPEPTLDELYQLALKEGGKLTWYAAMPPANAKVFIPLFEKRFPGITVEQVDQTAEDALARAVAEKRAGRVVADVFGSQFTVAGEASRQGLLLKGWLPSEAKGLPEGFYGDDWFAADVQSLILGWNTNLVGAADAPKTWADATDPKWKDSIIAEPDNYHIMIAITNAKFGGDKAKGEAFFREVAANGVQFHAGHSNLAELLVAGQAKLCFGCYSHHFPPRIGKGAPINYELAEGVANIVTTSVTDGAPHPNTAKLFVRWSLSDEGQRAYAEAGRTPARPGIEPKLPVKAVTLYPVGPEDLDAWPEAQALWKEIFNLR